MCAFSATHTAVSPVNVEEGEGEKSLVALLGKELLFKLDKISFKVDHFWCTAVRPAQKRKQRVLRDQLYGIYDEYYFHCPITENTGILLYYSQPTF